MSMASLPAENMASPLIINPRKRPPVPAPRKRPPVPAPRKRPPVPAPRKRPPVPAPRKRPPVPAPHQRTPEPAPRQRTPEPTPAERPQESALPERTQESTPPVRPQVPDGRWSPSFPQGNFWGGSRAPAEETEAGAGAAVSEAVPPWPPELPGSAMASRAPWIRHGLPSSLLRRGSRNGRRPGGLLSCPVSVSLEASRAPPPHPPTPPPTPLDGIRYIREGGVLSDLCSPCHVFPLLSCPYLVSSCSCPHL